MFFDDSLGFSCSSARLWYGIFHKSSGLVLRNYLIYSCYTKTIISKTGVAEVEDENI